MSLSCCAGVLRYLEEIHITALANVLRRPVILLAGEYEGGFFLPSRLDPQVRGADHTTSRNARGPPSLWRRSQS